MAAAAVLLELILRLVLGMGRPVLYVADRACGYLPAPNQNLHRFFSVIQINSDSMRSPPVRPKTADEFRILFIGDSVTHGQSYMTQGRIFTSLLGESLPAQFHKPVTIYNASAGGWAVGNEVGYLRSRGSFQADVIVMVLNTDDLFQPFNDTQPGTPQMPDKNPPLAIAEVWSRYISPHFFHVDLADKGSSVTTPKEEEQPVGTTISQLVEARGLANSHGAGLAIVYSPIFVKGVLTPDPKGAFTELKKWAASARVPLLDLTAADTDASPSTVFHDHIHMSERGHEVAKAAIERWLDASTLSELQAQVHELAK